MIDWDAQPLGVVSDGKLAAELGVSKQAVADARRTRGIPPRRAHCPPSTPDAGRTRAELAVIDLLSECTGGLTLDAIADELDLPTRYLTPVLADLDVAGVLRVERHGFAGRFWVIA